MRRPRTRTLLAVGGALCVLTGAAVAEDRGATAGKGVLGSGRGPAEAGALDPVRGQGCYTYGDGETPKLAKQVALAEARQAAAEQYRVYVQSATQVTNLQVDQDVIQSASLAVLHEVKVAREEEHGREICIVIDAKIRPVALEEFIRQRLQAKEVAQAAQAPVLPKGSGFGLRVWTNRPEGRFTEGDALLVAAVRMEPAPAETEAAPAEERDLQRAA